MQPTLQPGVTGDLVWPVTAERVIALGGAGARGATVFSTPAMIELMEYAARGVLEPYLEADEESVGVRVEVEHLAATPVGSQVTGTAKVIHVDGRLIDFAITARDEIDVIGRGTHRRAVVRMEKVSRKLQEKAARLGESAVVPSTPSRHEGDLPRLELILVEADGPLAHITLNRPAKRNAVNLQMTSEWELLNAWLARHPEIRVAILSGAGESFCAGDDVPEVGTLPLEEARSLSLRQARMYLEWEQLPQVFIAAVQGKALGAGCVAAYSCDFRIASHDARFGMPEILLGWPPGYGVAQLTALIGKARALEMCLTGEQISARTALDYGIVHEVVPKGQLSSTAHQLAEKLLAQPAEALRATKRLIHLDEGTRPKLAHLADTEAYIRCLALPDAQEGIAAFREKRKPRYQ